MVWTSAPVLIVFLPGASRFRGFGRFSCHIGSSIPATVPKVAPKICLWMSGLTKFQPTVTCVWVIFSSEPWRSPESASLGSGPVTCYELPPESSMRIPQRANNSSEARSHDPVRQKQVHRQQAIFITQMIDYHVTLYGRMMRVLASIQSGRPPHTEPESSDLDGPHPINVIVTLSSF